MSTLHHEDMLLEIFEDVKEAFPYLDEEKQIEIANNRFYDIVFIINICFKSFLNIIKFVLVCNNFI